jgi:hypothetical protein
MILFYSAAENAAIWSPVKRSLRFSNLVFGGMVVPLAI